MTRPCSARCFRYAIALACAIASPLASGAEIILDGSTGMLPLAKALASGYQKRAADPVVMTGEGLGTGARLRALGEGKIQVALASHGIKAEDVQKGNLKVIDVAKGAIVFAVNESVAIARISDAQVCDIYAGRTGNWKALGGPDQPIVVLTRPPTEVDPEVIRAKVACFKDLKESAAAKVMARGGDMAKALAETPYALGMTSMTVVEQSAGKVKALAFNGVAPAPAEVKSGSYPLTRDFLFVTRGEPAGPLKAFLDFVLSAEGDRIIQANGAVPLR